MSYSFKSDVYSLIMILYGLFKLKDDKYGSPQFVSSHDLSIAKNKLREFDSEFAKKDFIKVFPKELQGVASRALSTNPASRPELQELKVNPWFQDNLVKGIYYMDNFFTLPEPNKKVFLQSLAKMVSEYSQDIVEKRIVPFITNNMVQPLLMHGLTLIALVIVDKKLVRENRMQ
jgi:serine/threonine protein kinase